jgi:flagellar assembly protein FliH
MGRVVKNASLSREPYLLNVPAQAAVPSPNGHADEGVILADTPVVAPVKRPPPRPASPTIDWEALRAEAAALIDGAAEHAQTLVGEAGARAKALVQEAVGRANAVTQAAHNEGFETGREAGRSAADQEMNEMLVTMRGLVDMARAERHKIVESAEPEIVKLAMGIAERVLHKQVGLDRDVVVEMAKAAIGRLLEREIVTVRVNPADLERMREHRDDVLALGDVKHMRIIEDQRVDRGGVIVETESGSVDANISTQVEEARRILRIEDEVVIAPDPNGTLETGNVESGLESAAAT